jgi:hypothetical protein
MPCPSLMLALAPSSVQGLLGKCLSLCSARVRPQIESSPSDSFLQGIARLVGSGEIGMYVCMYVFSPSDSFLQGIARHFGSGEICKYVCTCACMHVVHQIRFFKELHVTLDLGKYASMYVRVRACM